MTALDYNWEVAEPDIMVKAMVLANETLFAAGPLDVADEKELWGKSHTKKYQRKMKKQAASLRAEMGSKLWIISKKRGKRLGTLARKVGPGVFVEMDLLEG